MLLAQLFEHVIAYLRAVQYQEPEPDLPGSAKDLALLLREAKYYALPGLAQRIQVTHTGHRASNLLQRHSGVVHDASVVMAGLATSCEGGLLYRPVQPGAACTNSHVHLCMTQRS